MSKLTWTDQQNIAKQTAGLSDSANLAKFKRDMNVGASKFLANLGREYNRHSRYTDLISGQQFYQMPEDAFKLKELIVSTGSYRPPMEQIPDEFAWNMMNMLSITGQPTHYWIRGNKEFGLYPTPANTITDGIELVFSPRHVEMTHEDVTSESTTTTVQVSSGSVTVTNSGTIFTPDMVGQWFQNTDGSDENWYQIASYVNTSNITLENYYQGNSKGTATFRIGQVMDLPEEYLEAPVDYAMYRHYLRRGDANKAAEFKALWQDGLDGAKNTYGNPTESQVIAAEPQFRIYNPFRGDPPARISA